MIIRRLELTSFGKFQDYNLELQDGLNLVYGENESGKSTLHSFINGIFYGFLKPFSKKTIYLEDHENYNPIGSNIYRGNLEFEIGGVIYRIERDFKKGNENTRIYEKLTGEDITYKASDLSAGKIVQPGIYFFGLNDLVFKNTVFISQRGVYTDEKLADEVRDRLVNVVTTKDESISVNKALDILDQDLKEIGTQRAYTSKYGLLVKRLIDKNLDLKTIKEKKSVYNEFIEKAEEINIEREKLKVEVEKKDDLLKQIYLSKRIKKYKEALDLEKQIELLNKEAASLNEYRNIDIGDYSKAEYLKHDIENLTLQIEATKAEIENLDYEKKSVGIWSESEVKKLDEIIDDGFKVKYIEDKLEKDSLSEIEEQIGWHKKNIKNIRTLIALASVLYLSLVFYSLVAKNYILLAATQSILLSIVLLVHRLKKYRDKIKPLNSNQDLHRDLLDIISKYGLDSINDFLLELESAKNKKEEITSKKTNLIRINDRIETASYNLSKLETMLIDNKNDLDKILLANRQSSLEDFKISKSKKLRFEDVEKELSNCNKAFYMLLDGKQIEDLKVDKDKIKSSEIKLEEFDEENLLESLKRLKSRLEKLSLDYKGYEVKIQSLEEEIAKEASLKEDILDLEGKIDYLDKKKNAILYATKRIKELSTDIHRDYAPIINKKVGQMVNKITGGNYKSVKIDKNLNIGLESEDGDRLLSFNKLSAGTIDQIYFSLRMGLTEEIIHRDLPLVFDECFAQYDDLRLNSILKFLLEKDKKRQIILFTCHNREKKVLDNLGLDYKYINL